MKWIFPTFKKEIKEINHVGGMEGKITKHKFSHQVDQSQLISYFYFLSASHLICYSPIFSYLSHIIRRLLFASQITELVLCLLARWWGTGFMFINLPHCITADVVLIAVWGMLFAGSQAGFAPLSCPGRFSRGRDAYCCHQSFP